MCKALRVLIVEDEAPILLQLEAILEDEQLEVVGTAMSSVDAIQQMAVQPVDLVLIDLNLADGFTGKDVAAEAIAAGIDVVFMTANPLQVGDFKGAAGFLPKPFSRSSVTATIRFVAECLQDPPPRLERPGEFAMAAEFARKSGITHAI